MAIRPLTLLIGVGAGLGLLALLTSSKTTQAQPAAASPGARAQIGDEVHVPLASFPGVNIPGLPPGAAIVAVQVQRADTQNLGGPIVAVVTPGAAQPRTQFPTTFGNFSVPRAAVLAVTRGGGAPI